MKLVIAEKPSVAKSIAAVMGVTEKKDGYLEGNGYIVTWCIGHLIELASPESYYEQWKRWNYETLPMIPVEWQYEVKKETNAQFKILKKLMHEKSVESVVCATDAGREGELIFRLVYEKAGCKKPIERLWISSMEDAAIREGFKNLRPGSDYDNLYHAALCRQEADWLVGLNGTRLFTVLYGSKVLKVGRVQTPTLAMLVEREEQIRTFQKEKYHVVHLLMDGMDAVTEKICEKSEAERIMTACNGKDTMSKSVEKERKTTAPPKLYDLTTLQRDANRIFGFTAKQTLEYTQALYEKKLVTYPRTDSQYLSDDMHKTAEGVIDVINKSELFKETISCQPDIQRVLNSKKVTDHHAIIPTMELSSTDLSKIPESEKKVLSLIANRLLCAVSEKYEYETVKAELICEGITFTATGKTVLKEGWKGVESILRHSYKTNEEKPEEEKKLPEIVEGQIFKECETKLTEHFTKPPKHYTEDSLLSAMERAGTEDMGEDVERKGLGTPATRAEIIEKLVKDGFVKREKKQMLPTEDGIKLITILPDVVKSPKLTANWENTLSLVAKGECDREVFMDGIKTLVIDLVEIYQSVSEDQKKLFSEEIVLGKCPHCKADIIKGKFGAYCKAKCGMNVSRAMGNVLTDSQIKNLLEGKKILMKGLKGKNGTYDAYLIPEGIEKFTYTKEGQERTGYQYKFKMEFPKKK